MHYLLDTTTKRRRARVIEIRVDELLEEQEKTFYWLSKETGISHTTLWRLKKGKALGINFDTLEKICTALQGQPGDVLTVPNHKKRQKTQISPRVTPNAGGKKKR